MNELKNSIEYLANEEGKSELEIISMLQFAASETGDDQMLDDLCKIKWDYIKK